LTSCDDRLVEEVRRSLEEGMADRAKQDVDNGAVAQSIVDSRGPAAPARWTTHQLNNLIPVARK
jgi:hypothetical protein